MTWLLVLVLGFGCDVLGEDDPEKNCDPRIPFWPDTDGDGIGDEGSSVYVGCEAPDGYVDVPPGSDTDPASDTDEG